MMNRQRPKKGDPEQRDPGISAPGIAKKLDFDATTASSDTTTTNTPLLLGVGLMVVAVGCYGMSGKR